MNQRIKLLAEQAKEHANSYDDAGTPIWFQFYNEKFAQLIVQECAELAYDGPGGILEHFGVEP